MNRVFQVQKFLQHQGKANAKFLTTNDDKMRSQQWICLSLEVFYLDKED